VNVHGSPHIGAMSEPSAIVKPVRLAALGCILASGPDARAFLQGQLSADVAALTAHDVLLASCNSPQGRVQAILWLIERADGVALLLPASMVEMTLVRLRKYVLRSKAKLENGGDRLAVGVLERRALPPAISLDREPAHAQQDDVSYIRLPGHADALTLGAASMLDAHPAAEQRWCLEAIRAGLPQVYPQTHETFVAQMLNLDVLGGISFSKGCYTGQEIVARAHYRGSVKRRMFRYSANCAPPAPGTRVVDGGQHAGDVVHAAATDAGCELLAVISNADTHTQLRLDDESAAALVRMEMPYQA
jgi:folate-binding protein YgfZ